MSAENGHGPVLTSALVRSVVGEVAERLAAFASSGETAAIDLRSLTHGAATFTRMFARYEPMPESAAAKVQG